MSVLVVGSFMTDLVARTNFSPTPGQTVIGNSFGTYLGGKGANQAVASKRAGSKTYMVGALGDDSLGNNFLNFFKQSGFDPHHIVIKPNQVSGVGHIVINENTGQNQIIIIPGANLLFNRSDLLKYQNLFEEVSIVVNQLEMDDDIVIASKELALKHNKLYLLNPAPYKKLPDHVLKGIDFITPNETELAAFVGKDELTTMEDFQKASQELINKGIKNVITTLGEKGAMHCDKHGCTIYPAFEDKIVIDTVAAGDAFNGTFAAMIDQGLAINEAVIYANAAGALTTTKKGAIPSIPTIQEIKAFIAKHQVDK